VEEVETPDMLKLAVDYYKILSAKEEKLDILLIDFIRNLMIWLMRRKMLCLMLLSGRKRARSQYCGHIC
jgi:hypothetical protein